MNRKPQDMETLHVMETHFSRVKHPVSFHAGTTHPRIPTAEPLILLHVNQLWVSDDGTTRPPCAFTSTGATVSTQLST